MFWDTEWENVVFPDYDDFKINIACQHLLTKHMQVVLTISTIFRIHHEFPILIIWVKSIVFTLRGRFYCFFSFALCFPYDLRACLPKWSCKFMTKYIIMANLLGHYYLLNNPSFECNPKHLSRSTSNIFTSTGIKLLKTTSYRRVKHFLNDLSILFKRWRIIP